MSNQQTCTLFLSVLAAADLTRGQAIGWNNQPAGAGGSIQGFANEDIATGYAGTCNQGPTSLALAGAAISAANTDLEVDATGRLIPSAGGTVVAKLKLGSTASAAGELVEVFPLIVA